jgi:methionine-S-sulfoxide reductase
MNMNGLWMLVWAAVLSACTRSPDRAEVQKPGSAEKAVLPSVSEPAQTSEGAKTNVTEQANREIAILAGGCFWGMEDILRGVDGVLDTEVGYAGGSTESPTYESVKTGRTGHAESVRVVFDPSRISYAELLEKWFFRMHDPTTKDRQGNDRGTQYRSAIFAASEAQAQTAREVIQRVDASGKWGSPIVTEVVAAGSFTPAEDYHQDYLEEHPNGYTCHFLRNF